MSDYWPAWVAQLKADGKFMTVPAITRGKNYGFTMVVASDVSADVFAASIRLSPDAAGATLADFTVSVGSYSAGVTRVEFSLTDTQTGSSGDLPTDSDYDGLVGLVLDVLHTPDGLVAYRCGGGIVQVSGAVT